MFTKLVYLKDIDGSKCKLPDISKMLKEPDVVGIHVGSSQHYHFKVMLFSTFNCYGVFST